MLQIVKASHLDHGLSKAHINFLDDRFAARDGFFMETIELPPELDSLMCTLRGPAMGDPPVSEIEVYYKVRGERPYASRMHSMPARPTRFVSVIAGPGHGHSCMLYTSFGGPITPQEPGELLALVDTLRAAGEIDKLADAQVKLSKSAEFWLHHALGEM